MSKFKSMQVVYEELSQKDISDAITKKNIDAGVSTKRTKKELAAIKQRKKENYWKNRGYTLIGDHGKGELEDDGIDVDGIDRSGASKPEVDEWSLSQDDGLTDEERGDKNPVREFPANYAYVSPIDWKFKGDDGRLSYELYNGIRNATVHAKEVPAFAITREESEKYLTLPVMQIKYVIKLALKYELDITDSVWDLIQAKSVSKSAKLHNQAGLDADDFSGSNYYGEKFISIGDVYGEMYTPIPWSDLDSLLLLKDILTESMADENNVQGSLLQRLAGTDNELMMELIEFYGGIWRKCINKYKARLNRGPTTRDLIRYSNHEVGRDVKTVIKELKRKISQSEIDFYK